MIRLHHLAYKLYMRQTACEQVTCSHAAGNLLTRSLWMDANETTCFGLLERHHQVLQSSRRLNIVCVWRMLRSHHLAYKLYMRQTACEQVTCSHAVYGRMLMKLHVSAYSDAIIRFYKVLRD